MPDLTLVNKQMLADLLTELTNEQDAAKAALLSFERLVTKIQDLFASGENDQIAAMLETVKQNSAAFVLATTRGTELESVISPEAVQAAADTFPDSANAPIDGSALTQEPTQETV